MLKILSLVRDVPLLHHSIELEGLLEVLVVSGAIYFRGSLLQPLRRLTTKGHYGIERSYSVTILLDTFDHHSKASHQRLKSFRTICRTKVRHQDYSHLYLVTPNSV